MRAPTVVLFTRDLRVNDHPALAAAAAGDGAVIPLFVIDDALLRGAHLAPNRVAFLVASLQDLRASLEARGSTLLVRRGDVVQETMRIVEATGAGAVHLSADVTAYAKRRERSLLAEAERSGVRMVRFPGVTLVPPGELRTGTHEHYRVFTPYWRAWREHPWRERAEAPQGLHSPTALPLAEPIPSWQELVDGATSPRLMRGGEREGRLRMEAWLLGGVARYDVTHDDLVGTGTSRLSPYIHFGCVSTLELARRSLAEADGEAFVRQLCWRDFHHQVADAFPAIARRDYRPRGRTWLWRPDLFAAWQQGRTGVGVVDAAMRQLLAEGWMPNRARLIASAYLVKTLGIDWRLGAAHFMQWLVDGDVANNSGNWQWVAGTGNDTRPNRGFNVQRQARRFDAEGSYVREHLPHNGGRGSRDSYEATGAMRDACPPLVTNRMTT